MHNTDYFEYFFGAMDEWRWKIIDNFVVYHLFHAFAFYQKKKKIDEFKRYSCWCYQKQYIQCFISFFFLLHSLIFKNIKCTDNMRKSYGHDLCWFFPSLSLYSFSLARLLFFTSLRCSFECNNDLCSWDTTFAHTLDHNFGLINRTVVVKNTINQTMYR